MGKYTPGDGTCPNGNCTETTVTLEGTAVDFKHVYFPIEEKSRYEKLYDFSLLFQIAALSN